MAAFSGVELFTVKPIGNKKVCFLQNDNSSVHHKKTDLHMSASHSALKMVTKSSLFGVDNLKNKLPLSQTSSRSRSLGVVNACITVNGEAPVAIVTEGSRGIGKSIVLALVKSGCKVLMQYSDRKLEKEAYDVSRKIELADYKHRHADIPNPGNPRYRRILVEGRELTEAKQVAYLFNCAYLIWGKVDIFVNNAGDAMINSEDADGRLKNLSFCTEEIARIMAERQGKGKIVNVTCMSGGIDGHVNQDTSNKIRDGMIDFSKSVARQYENVLMVNAVVPTPKTVPPPELLKTVKPANVVGVVKWLALDPAAKDITEQAIYIKGKITSSSNQKLD